MDITQDQAFAAIGRLTVENSLLRAEVLRLRAELARVVKTPESSGDASVSPEPEAVG